MRPYFNDWRILKTNCLTITYDHFKYLIHQYYKRIFMFNQNVGDYNL